MVTEYAEFLRSKVHAVPSNGPSVDPGAVNPFLFPFQRDLTRWAVRKGRAALFADTGLGKTFMQLEWARLIGERTLIVAPLSVARQTIREAHKIGLEPVYSRDGKPAGAITVTNYEMVEHFDPADFRGDVIRLFIGRGWTFHGEVTIDKDPQAQAIRTKAKGLLFVQKERDRSWLRPAFADYILVFRKPGDNAVPIQLDQVSNNDWIEWARPIWYGIRESATLNAAEAREEKDERHIAALQLETVMRCVRLWSNPGELVLDPFAGIGTTGYVAVEHGRRFVGCELKQSYFEAACRNIARSDARLTLFSDVAMPA